MKKGDRSQKRTSSFCRLFVVVRDLQQHRFLKMICAKLHADRKSFGVDSAWNRYSRKTCEITRDRENVRQIHRERVGGLFTDLERDGRAGWGQNDIDALESLLEVLKNESPDFECLEIVRIVIAGAQRVGSQENAPLDFFAEARHAGLSIHFAQPAI